MKWICIAICFFLVIALDLTIEQPLMKQTDEKNLLFFENIRTKSSNYLFHFFTEIGSIKFLLPLAIIVTSAYRTW